MENILEQMNATTEILTQVQCSIVDLESESALKKHIMAKDNLLISSKLFMLYLIEHDVTEFKAPKINNVIGIEKPHWLRYIKPQLLEAGFISQINRTTFRFLNPNKIF